MTKQITIPTTDSGQIAELSEQNLADSSEQDLQLVSDNLQKEIDSLQLKKSKIDSVTLDKRNIRLNKL
jgi:hypothetical protein